MMEKNFKEELQLLSESHKSEKLDYVKMILKKAASDGARFCTIDSSKYDEWVVKWLKAQGFKVDETHDQREGDFMRVSW